MLELIVCGNIVGLDIPLRVVQHELWRPHILETTADDYSSDCEAEVRNATAVLLVVAPPPPASQVSLFSCVCLLRSSLRT